MSAVDYVRAFHLKFGQPIRDRPKMPAKQERVLRSTLIAEEALEARTAIVKGGSIGSVAQELADLVYVCYGAALHYGIDLDAAIAEVHRANMTKVWPDGMARYRLDGKLEKGPLYQPPNMLRAIGVE